MADPTVAPRPSRRRFLTFAPAAIAAPLFGDILKPPVAPPSPPLARQALRARAEALIADVKEAGAALALTSERPDTLWISVPLYGERDDPRIERLRRQISSRPLLRRAVHAVLSERYGLAGRA